MLRFEEDMGEIGQIIQTIIVIAIVAAFLAYFLIEIFYKGKKVRIHVVKKRVTEHKGLNQMRSKEITVNNYSVDCKYDSKPNKIHTLGCSFLVYDELKQDKSYTVNVKLNRITKIYK
ncbi:MAG: hypothetical protein ACI4J1_10015 [Ruminiclostridium sp.]